MNNYNYLFRNIAFSPDYVTMKYDIPIKWLQESTFYAIKKIPNVFWGENEFKNCEITNNSIKVPFYLWAEKISLLSKTFNEGFEIIQLSNCIDKEIKFFEKTIKLAEKQLHQAIKLSSDIVLSIFEGIIRLDSFAIFNILIPRILYTNLLDSIDIDADIDKFMVCDFLPHRKLVRLKKIELAIEYEEKGYINKNSLDSYKKNTLAYEQFVEWCFDQSKFNNDKILLKEIQSITENNSISELQKEKDFIIKSHNLSKEKKNKLLKSIYNIDSKLSEKLSLLSNITNEEEKRHMLEARSFVILGNIFKNYRLDPSRTTINEVVTTVKMLNGEYYD